MRRRGNIRCLLVLFVATSSLASGQKPLDFERYVEEIEPIFLAPRGGLGPGMSPCATCHIHNGTPLKLERLERDASGGVHWTRQQSERNFEVVARLVVPGRPDQSRLLRKALAVAEGGSPFHVGGEFFRSKDDPEWRKMADWVRDADSLPFDTKPPPVLDFEFFESCVQQIFLDKRDGRVECFHCHDAGIRGFAPSIPDGRAYWNRAESRENFLLVKRYVEPGFPLRSRFLTHPLAPEAGGDHFHGGGRRWTTQDDPEWQMLAAWVRGEAPRCVLARQTR